MATDENGEDEGDPMDTVPIVRKARGPAAESGAEEETEEPEAGAASPFVSDSGDDAAPDGDPARKAASKAPQTPERPEEAAGFAASVSSAAAKAPDAPTPAPERAERPTRQERREDAAAVKTATRAWWGAVGPILGRHWPDIVIALVAILVIVALVVTGSTARQRQEEINAYESEQARMARKFGFNPGLIITDEMMFDADSMTESEIDTFLSERGVDCEGDLCLSTIRVSSADEEADELCRGYSAADNLSAAHIIRGVAESCGVNPQVLIVMLQKEQGLVTATDPKESAYTIAMGLSCPDNGMCDTAYYGFFTQVYGAAHRLKYYRAHFDQYNYKPGQVNDILYNPDASCGSGKVYIENDATAMLYIYTPYQPNEAALEGLRDGKGGTGDACSTYGNRNFALFFNAWFGDPTQGQATEG